MIEESVAPEDFAADFAEEEFTGADSADADEAAANGEEAVEEAPMDEGGNMGGGEVIEE